MVTHPLPRLAVRPSARQSSHSKRGRRPAPNSSQQPLRTGLPRPANNKQPTPFFFEGVSEGARASVRGGRGRGSAPGSIGCTAPRARPIPNSWCLPPPPHQPKQGLPSPHIVPRPLRFKDAPPDHLYRPSFDPRSPRAGALASGRAARAPPPGGREREQLGRERLPDRSRQCDQDLSSSLSRGLGGSFGNGYGECCWDWADQLAAGFAVSLFKVGWGGGGQVRGSGWWIAGC